jgi:two-component system phosphate regulon sensor histidine kinase PhoR
MKMRKKTVGLIIAMTLLSLVGLLCIQVYLLMNTYKLEKQAFRQNVNSALGSAVRRLEIEDTAFDVIRVALDDEGELFKHDILFQPDSGDYTTVLPGGHLVQIKMIDSADTAVRDLVDRFEERIGREGDKSVEIEEVRVEADNPSEDSLTTTIIIGTKTNDGDTLRFSSKVMRRKLLVDKVVRQWTHGSPRSIEERITAAKLDSVVADALDQADITTPCVYGIVVASSADSVLFQSEIGFEKQLSRSAFKRTLFPGDIIHHRDMLAFYFPREGFYIFRKISFSVLTSFVLVAIIAASFVYTIRTIFLQRKLSERISNFINNMTHEFKTPISTIALASESLSRQNKKLSAEKAGKYAKVIHEENARMRDQVEKILQMAVLEEGDFELKRTAVDVHELLEKAVDKVRVQLESKGGKVTTDYGAVSAGIMADALHLTNVIHNILDNAIKYSAEKVRISIRTESVAGGAIRIRFSDKGIGLSPEDQKFIFDKYYRVSTGNLHDVKGFGLGLSYVKLMVESHGGSVRIESQKGRGTVFEIILPLAERLDNGK